ncbi:phosphoglycerate transporter protein [Klebsiella pneumoniae]|jgi:OPA family phosphoglycerate-like MFS transporter|uniref:Phosphoglycerate transporter protein n=11 Tax=Klebsiella pneumoniae TaxID=573 RepID=A0A0H3GPW9_KLEPH|nr:MFS transporter [Klebsiella pneumoniae]YP_005226965.1 phosphoglycerate transporter protein [Klebsiella pneumoniae subsp. pneumoniae HS11286]AGT24261.1 phosphoglycerate transporter protein [Klebsiella pneumoniae JM45]AUS19995.1 MFS transporter [Klebsiella pneumoniae subsp. pneumoniae]EMR22749.1 phosphoglycerate transporter protein [Klebsiella pneumoniae ATCC BAA-2146]KDI54405.1 phosphoglycerate transporter [Klebsiella pneumoniae CHS 24]KDL74837.1 phosphoglycerate transporter [Klebsiella pne
MLSLLKKGPSANKVPAEKIQATYGRYRMQALLSVFLGYLAYYIVRNNFTLSTPYLKEQLDLSATQIGLLSSCMLIAYGISKGVMSSLADKASPKVFMACGLVLCAIVNVGLGFSTAFWVFAALVVLNGLFQGMGVGPSFITHIMRLLISLWDVGTVFFTIYPQVFRHEKSSIYYKYIEPLSYCFSISFKILIITVYGFMKWYICKCLFCKVYLLDLSYNRNAKPMTGSNELRFNLTQIRG